MICWVATNQLLTVAALSTDIVRDPKDGVQPQGRSLQVCPASNSFAMPWAEVIFPFSNFNYLNQTR
jgi:hypothetical protein